MPAEISIQVFRCFSLGSPLDYGLLSRESTVKSFKMNCLRHLSQPSMIRNSKFWHLCSQSQEISKICTQLLLSLGILYIPLYNSIASFYLQLLETPQRDKLPMDWLMGSPHCIYIFLKTSFLQSQILQKLAHILLHMYFVINTFFKIVSMEMWPLANYLGEDRDFI